MKILASTPLCINEHLLNMIMKFYMDLRKLYSILKIELNFMEENDRKIMKSIKVGIKTEEI